MVWIRLKSKLLIILASMMLVWLIYTLYKTEKNTIFRFLKHNRTRIKIHIYGHFYNEILMPEFDNVSSKMREDFIISRSEHIQEFDVVILHFMEYKKFLKDYRSHRSNMKKIMIVFSMESPSSIKNDFDVNMEKDYFYYWSSNYYRSSLFPTYYGAFYKKKSHDFKCKLIENEFFLRRNSSLSIISNCDTERTIRLDYIEELNRYFPVSAFGKCFSNRISNEEIYLKVKEYKFYLSFENSFCEEYFTEKYWRALEHGMIPVVMGHFINAKYMIPNSYINVFDFDSPEKLAAYLHYVSSNLEEYRKFFLWKKDFHLKIKPFSQDIYKILEHIKNAIIKNTVSDDLTIYKISNESICIPNEQQKKTLMT